MGVSFTNQPQSQDPLSHKPDRLGEAVGQPDPPDLDRDLVHLEEVSPRVLTSWRVVGGLSEMGMWGRGVSDRQ